MHSDGARGTTCTCSTAEDLTVPEMPTDTTKATVEPNENEKERVQNPTSCRPSASSLIVACGYVFLSVASFTIAIPSSIRYTESFGVSQAFSGIMVGIVPLFGAFAQFPMIRIYERFSMTSILSSFLLIKIVDHAFYALGGVTNSYTIVLIGRGISGIVGGPTFAKTYIARTTDKEHRLQYMEYLSVSIGLGYALGPAMGVVIEVVCNKAGWDSALLNADTAVGWWCVFLFMLQLPHVFFAFQEPPLLEHFADSNAASTVFASDAPFRIPAATEHRLSNATYSTLSNEALIDEDGQSIEKDLKSDRGSLFKYLLIWSVLVLLVQMDVGVFEVASIYRATSTFSNANSSDRWGWDTAGAAGHLSIVNWIPVILSLIIPIRRFVTTDMQGARGSFLFIIVASVFLFDYDAVVPSTIGQVSIYSFGSAISLFAIQTGKGFTFSKASKLPRTPAQKQPVMSTVSFVYSLGRALGAMVAPLLSSGQFTGLFFTISNLVAFLMIVVIGHFCPEE
ncbi:hypothetical protein ACA910_011992 [Epithemia clementina (nom. ined.)]